MASGDVDAVRGLLKAATVAAAHAPLDEHAWLDLVQGGREGFAGVVAWEADHDHPVGYGQVSRGEDSWALEFVVDPHHRVPGNTIGVVDSAGSARWLPVASCSTPGLAR